MKGAPERIFDICSSIMLHGETIPLNNELRDTFLKAYNDLGSLGERVLGFADLELPIDLYPIDYKFDTESINFPLTDLRFVETERARRRDEVSLCRH